MKRSDYYLFQAVLLFSIAIGQNSTDGVTGTNEEQLRRQMIQRQLGTDPKLTDPNMMDELLEMEQQFDSTNVPVKILIKPSEIESYYRLKLKRLKEDIIDLNLIETLLDSAGRLNYFGYDYFYNFDQHGITSKYKKFSLLWWKKRSEAFEYTKFLTKKLNKKFFKGPDYYITKLVNFFF